MPIEIAPEIAIAVILACIIGWFVDRIIMRKDYEDIYQMEYRRQIRLHKLARPYLAPYIDAETIRRGEGIIE